MSLNNELDRQLLEIIKSGNTVESIKFCKNFYELPMYESKLYIEKITVLNEINNGLYDSLQIEDCEVYYRLLQKHQDKIKSVDISFIQKFVKISNYLKTKQNNLISIYNSIKETKNINCLDEDVKILRNFIPLKSSYQNLLFHSISMITSVGKGDLITFYEIYECFDKLNVFNSNWENEISGKLSELGVKLDNIGNELLNIRGQLNDLLVSINKMESNILLSLDNLMYTTQESFEELNNSITNELNEINSSINFNNLLTGIQTYQLYRINKKTKIIE